MQLVVVARPAPWIGRRDAGADRPERLAVGVRLEQAPTHVPAYRAGASLPRARKSIEEPAHSFAPFPPLAARSALWPGSTIASISRANVSVAASAVTSSARSNPRARRRAAVRCLQNCRTARVSAGRALCPEVEGLSASLVARTAPAAVAGMPATRVAAK